MNFLQLTSSEAQKVIELMDVFAAAFDDQENYASKKPSVGYIGKLLDNPHNIVLVAIDNDVVIAGLIAYELQKFEQERSELYVFDLAVSHSHRRQGVATGLISLLKEIGQSRNATSIFVQADNEDTPALALYQKLSTAMHTDVTHFELM